MGSGPAGLQAALHAGRRKTSVAVLGKLKNSSLSRAHLENYCCMDNQVMGNELLDQGKQQALRSGAVFYDEDVLDIGIEDKGHFSVLIESEKILKAKALILSMGISRNRLNVPGEKEFLGKGVSYCVDCDGGFFKGQTVAVVGSESAAASGAMTLLLIAEKVHLIYHELQVSDSLKNQVEKSDIIKHPGRRVTAIEGKESVERLIFENGESMNVDGIFIELGAKGALGLASKLGVSLDPENFKYIITNKKQETNIPGIYAAGDICGPPWQVAKAVGEGCIAGLEAAAYAKKH
ncbi:MAG: NAD(P)/FAD-dependent oxidoreductase [Desulfobacterales bacterium]|nr:NAD(P)/FAD-dependent oxidoreductase [Desulfobacterales bacterium]